MRDIKRLISKYSTELDTIGGFLFVAGLFYMLYIALWVVCPCG